MKKNRIFLLIIACIVFVLVGCTSEKNEKNKKEATPSSNSVTSQKSTIPTLFIHGYSGGNNSFGRMIKRLEASNLTKKELVLTVSPEGEIQAKGSLTGKKNNPSVQVLFKENKSHEWNQAEWIKSCLEYLRDTYGTKEVNLVGHSMGGASSLRYLTTFGDESHLPKVLKFVGIAAPFNNFVELPNDETLEDVINKGPSIQSERYADYVAGMEKVAQDMNVLLIAGDVKDGSSSDEAVSVDDALSVVSLFKNHHNNIKEQVFYGKSAQHSKLHENTEVDQLVADFLWK